MSDSGSESSNSDNPTEAASSSAFNKFANDGSFLTMFQKSGAKSEEATTKPKSSALPPKTEGQEPVPELPVKKPAPVPLIGKRRGGKVLPTGKVKKPKPENAEESTKQDVLSKYMSEVKKYKERTCEDESRTTPLVK